jgi:hypothetical protein
MYEYHKSKKKKRVFFQLQIEGFASSSRDLDNNHSI